MRPLNTSFVASEKAIKAAGGQLCELCCRYGQATKADTTGLIEHEYVSGVFKTMPLCNPCNDMLQNEKSIQEAQAS